VPVIDATTLAGPVEGPALLVEPHSTFVLDPGWRVERVVDLAGRIALRAVRCARVDAVVTTPAEGVPDPARLEVFNGLFTHVATQMGEVLRRTAQSVNIKERLDFSCALFDGEGRLVANAPHIPVHLGSMGATVRALLDSRRGRMGAGDAWMVNSPWHGGTHLPDITVVSPVFVDGSRGRRADVLRRLARAPRRHRRQHARLDAAVQPARRRGRHPVRGLRAGVRGRAARDGAARRARRGRTGRRATRIATSPTCARSWPPTPAAPTSCGARCGTGACLRWCRRCSDVQDNAAAAVAAAIVALGDRRGRREVPMDDGPASSSKWSSTRRRGRARIDFSGTSAAGAHNFNAPRAVCLAAVLYVFRTLVRTADPAQRRLPRAARDRDPARLAARPAAGQRGRRGQRRDLAGDRRCALRRARRARGLAGHDEQPDLRRCRAAVLRDDRRRLGRGRRLRRLRRGADPHDELAPDGSRDPRATLPGAGARVRDPPRVGRRGRHRGGDGARRRIEFLAPMEGAILSNRRVTRPFGLHGGGEGEPGATRLIRIDGRIETLPACAAFRVEAGDIIEVSTPGGGGWGR
jgi:5-oxoprolinase (ATP-hydrolysing)